MVSNEWTVHLFSSSLQAMMFEARRTRGLLRFLEEEIDPLRSLNANPRAVSDIGYSIRSDPKTQEHFLTARIKLGYAASSLYEREL